MAQLPAWQLIDPLPILAQRESDDEGDEDDSLAALVETERDEADDKTEVMKDVTPASSNDNSARWMNDQ